MATRLQSDDGLASVSCLEHGVAWRTGHCHYHHAHELHLLLAPHERAYVGGEVHGLDANTVVLIGPRLAHNLAFDGPAGPGTSGRSLTLRFADEPLRRSMALLPELREVEPLLDLARHGVQFRSVGDAVVQRFHRIRDLRGLQRFSEFAGLLHQLARWPAPRPLSTRRRPPGPSGPDERARRIHRVVDHINEHYMTALTLSDACALAHMSPNHFSRTFCQVTGSTFLEAVIATRVAHACRLLLGSRKSVSDICFEVGFNNVSNFNRHFRALRGMTPREFRTCPA